LRKIRENKGNGNEKKKNNLKIPPKNETNKAHD
jgi:hypothetical protein